jgi:hypothetical protein
MTAFSYEPIPPSSAYALPEWRQVCRDIERRNTKKYLENYHKRLRGIYDYATSIPRPDAIEDRPQLANQLSSIDFLIETAMGKLLEICEKEGL